MVGGLLEVASDTLKLLCDLAQTILFPHFFAVTKPLRLWEECDCDNTEIVDDRGIVTKMGLLEGYREKIQGISAFVKLSLKTQIIFRLSLFH
jgi:hypothetical protein